MRSYRRRGGTGQSVIGPCSGRGPDAPTGLGLWSHDRGAGDPAAVMVRSRRHPRSWWGRMASTLVTDRLVTIETARPLLPASRPPARGAA